MKLESEVVGSKDKLAPVKSGKKPPFATDVSLFLPRRLTLCFSSKIARMDDCNRAACCASYRYTTGS
jgi:hypothetical protein